MNPIEIVNPTYPIISELSLIWLNNADLISERLGMLMLIGLLIGFGFRFFGNNTNREGLVIKAVSTVLLITVLMNVSVTVTPEPKSWTAVAPVSPVKTELSTGKLSKGPAKEVTTAEQPKYNPAPQGLVPSDLEPKTVKLLAVAPFLAMSAGMDIGKLILDEKDDPQIQPPSFDNNNPLTISETMEQSMALTIGFIQYFVFIVMMFGFIAHSIFAQPVKFLTLIFVSAVFTKFFLAFAEIPLEAMFGSDSSNSGALSGVEAAGWFAVIWIIALTKVSWSGSGTSKDRQTSESLATGAVIANPKGHSAPLKPNSQDTIDQSTSIDRAISPVTTPKAKQIGPEHSTELLSPGQTESAMKRIQHWLKDNF